MKVVRRVLVKPGALHSYAFVKEKRNEELLPVVQEKIRIRDGGIRGKFPRLSM